MSNDLIKSIRSQVATVEKGLDDDTRAVAGGNTGTGTKRISIKGGVFRKLVGGKEVASVEDRHMNVIFVKMAHNASRTYYKEGFQEGMKVSPACWSSDSKTPDENVPNPPAKSCDSCPYSVKGSGQNGTGAACRLSWRTAVVLPNDPSGDVLQLVLPATSCFGKEDNGKYPFRPYVQFLANNDISASRVITRMQFDTKATAPKLLFSPAAAVPPEDVDVIKAQSKSAIAEQLVKLTVFKPDEVTESAKPVAEEEVEVAEPAPVLREKKSAEEPAAPADASDIIKKWSKKK
jgi:hypothetical protein